jgi:hypothetical protein
MVERAQLRHVTRSTFVMASALCSRGSNSPWIFSLGVYTFRTYFSSHAYLQDAAHSGLSD